MKLGKLYLLLLHFSAGINAQTISPVFFGQNAWMPDTIGVAAACPNPPCILYGKLHKNWKKVKNSGAGVIRFGGIAADRNKPSNFQYIKMIDSIRAKGMEPVIQVPCHAGLYTAQQAAAIVQYINVTKARNIKYWIIGNEPDLDYGYTSASQVAPYIKSFASAMKAIDPTILTIGPECAWFNQSIINGLTSPGGADDITGKDASGRNYIDIISFHYYPFNGSQTRAQVISKLTLAGGLKDNLAYLATRLANCNSAHNRTGNSALKIAVTEANVNYQNSSTDNLSGNGVMSFVGGQFFSEFLGVCMKNQVFMINMWSVIEGNSTALNIGYIDPSTQNFKPAYYHYKLMADNFAGIFLSGTSNISNVKVFGSKSAQNIQVMILNQDLTANLPYTVQLNTLSVSGTTLVLNVNAGLNSSYTSTINNQTTVLLTFDLLGNLIRKCTYSLADHAAHNLPPSCEIMQGTLPVTIAHFTATVLSNKEVKLNWSTLSEYRNDYFTVERSFDGGEYSQIGKLRGAGSIDSPIHYSFTDTGEKPLLVYYRLRQTDFDKASVVSDVIAVSFDAEENISLAPNPSDGREATFSYLPDDAVITVRSVAGKNIQFDIAKLNGKTQLLPRSRLTNGLYIVTITGKNKVTTCKLLVARD